MCGGSGTRLAADTEKPLVPIGGVPMVERVRQALAASDIEHTYAVTTSRAPATAASLDLPIIRTPGDGYVADLDCALADGRVSRPVLTVAADLPLLDAGAVDTVLESVGEGSLTVAVPVGRKRALGLSVDTVLWHDTRRLTPAGINVVAAPDSGRVLVTRDRRFAANVNRPADRRTVEWYCRTR
ncbi:MAG: NTP transferase domain-containing protein [Halovenus sp.]